MNLREPAKNEGQVLMLPDSHDARLLWQKTSLLLYQSGEAQALIQSGADRSEVQECLTKVLTLAGEAMALTSSLAASPPSIRIVQAVIQSPPESQEEDREAA